MIAVIDYGVGNLRSVKKAFEALHVPVAIVSEAAEIAQADGIVLPGVGAFGDAMIALRRQGLLQPLRMYAKEGKPLLGICLGMQLLFSVSEEHGEHVGLGLIPGHVRRMRGEFKIPHVGWNQLQMQAQNPLLQDVQLGDYAYFVHSYYVDPVDKQAVIATTDYYFSVPAAVAKDNVYGLQFHPEKSGMTGLAILRNFARLCGQEEASV